MSVVHHDAQVLPLVRDQVVQQAHKAVQMQAAWLRRQLAVMQVAVYDRRAWPPDAVGHVCSGQPLARAPGPPTAVAPAPSVGNVRLYASKTAGRPPVGM